MCFSKEKTQKAGFGGEWAEKFQSFLEVEETGAKAFSSWDKSVVIRYLLASFSPSALLLPLLLFPSRFHFPVAPFCSVAIASHRIPSVALWFSGWTPHPFPSARACYRTKFPRYQQPFCLLPFLLLRAPTRTPLHTPPPPEIIPFDRIGLK